MNEFDRLVGAYRNGGPAPKPRLDMLLAIARIPDSRVVPFLLEVVRDQKELEEVRIYLVKRLRNGNGLLARAAGNWWQTP
jgi:hypothetical protein